MLLGSGVGAHWGVEHMMLNWYTPSSSSSPSSPSPASASPSNTAQVSPRRHTLRHTRVPNLASFISRLGLAPSSPPHSSPTTTPPPARRLTFQGQRERSDTHTPVLPRPRPAHHHRCAATRLRIRVPGDAQRLSLPQLRYPRGYEYEHRDGHEPGGGRGGRRMCGGGCGGGEEALLSALP